jgi:putative lipoic acid-binding regulatory protein
VSSPPLFGFAGRTISSRKSSLGGLRSLSVRIDAIAADQRNWFSS